jgi:O-acetylhomoserine (thiol)-lyase
VAWVSYAKLPGNKYNALADKYLGGRGGSVFTFGLKGGYEAGLRFSSPVPPLAGIASYSPRLLSVSERAVSLIISDFTSSPRLVERVELLSHLANLGDVRSLILHPASTTHRQLTAEQRAAVRLPPAPPSDIPTLD